MNTHTILGAGGTIANELTPLLIKSGKNLRLVSRQQHKVPGTESLAADLLDYQQTLKAIQGSSIVYLLVGLQYKTAIWEKSWPIIMTNVIDACKASGSKLIFFDNVYMYGKVEGAMTEATPFNPCSKKGALRARIAQQLLDEMKQGNVQAMIARAADFYSPHTTKTAVANLLVFENLSRGKKAQWLVNAHVPHSLTFTPDAGKALYMLAQQEDAFGQTWHLPTAADPITGAELIKLAAAALNRSDRFAVLSKWMIQLAGLFNSDIKESYEMLYQNEYPYLFDSSKFNQAFNFSPTSYDEGIKQMALTYSSRKPKV